jgi:hypothetical protein
MDMSTRGRDILHLQMKTDRGMWATHVTTILAEVAFPVELQEMCSKK